MSIGPALLSGILLSGGLVACGSTPDDSCEWEAKKISHFNYIELGRPVPRKVSPPRLQKPRQGSGGSVSKPLPKRTPAKPKKPAPAGYRWVLDCD